LLCAAGALLAGSLSGVPLYPVCVHTPPGHRCDPPCNAPACSALQEQLPDAKVLYSSATGASEPRNLGYMTRLGLWGAKDAVEFIELLSK
jgi:hypothetical protein